jgi:hypothetical protein
MKKLFIDRFGESLLSVQGSRIGQGSSHDLMTKEMQKLRQL